MYSITSASSLPREITLPLLKRVLVAVPAHASRLPALLLIESPDGSYSFLKCVRLSLVLELPLEFVVEQLVGDGGVLICEQSSRNGEIVGVGVRGERSTNLKKSGRKPSKEFTKSVFRALLTFDRMKHSKSTPTAERGRLTARLLRELTEE